jgi:hypothetical protein
MSRKRTQPDKIQQLPQMVTDDEYYEQHATLLGHVTLVWNDCQYMVFSIFHTLSGVSWGKASAIFLALRSDRDRREITLALMKQVLSTKNDEPMREKGTELLGQLAALAGERNLATHTMWVTVMPEREIQPHPALPRPKNLQADFKSQFSNLTTNLRNLFRELMKYEGGLRLHLEETAKRRSPENENGSRIVKPKRT